MRMPLVFAPDHSEFPYIIFFFISVYSIGKNKQRVKK
jgi:hypothetical protein